MKFDVRFSIYRYWQYVEHRPGLYFFFSRFDSKLLYIGKATDIHRRFTEYTGRNNHLEHEGLFHNVGSVGVVYIDDKSKLKESETRAIKHFKPPFNTLENYENVDKFNEKYKTGLQLELQRKKEEELKNSMESFSVFK